MQLVVFFSTCDAVDFHYTVVSGFRWSPTPWKGGGGENDERKLLGCDVFRLHGSMAQKDRTETFHQFGKATSAILLCTDVAARGLDFQCVSGIVQYEPPGDAAEYVHRLVQFLLLLVELRVMKSTI
jgi:ATP-dependent RNA helicase DDX31/DBP7